MKPFYALLAALLVTAIITAMPVNAGTPEMAPSDVVSGDIFFGTKSTELTPDAKKAVGEIYAWVGKHPDTIVMLAGYDDQRTPEEESVELGYKRANAVKDLLISLGVDPDRISITSFGNTHIALPGEGEEVWSKNRRVRYMVAGKADMDRMPGKKGGVCQRCKR